jgi:mycofactocin glycosyltransferase
MQATDASGPPPLPSPPAERALPRGYRVALDQRVRRWAGGAVLIGGSPWRVSRMAPASQAFVRRLADAGGAGVPAQTPLELQVARLLLDRGFAHPLPTGAVRPERAVVVPVLDRLASLAGLLATLRARPLLVVDDGSADPDAVGAVATAGGASVVHHRENRGPAAARNTGLRSTDTELVAFVDSDCRAGDEWPGDLLFHFDDPLVAAVAPRVVPDATAPGLLDRYESGRSALDMGATPELVQAGARLGFVPSAALVVRRAALGDSGFDEALRLGEDVDLVWRLTEAGWHVRFDPSVQVRHASRTRPRDWLVRRFEYGTSAPRLERRHPGNLAPAHLSAWNLAVIALLAGRRPALATATAAVATGLLWRQLRGVPQAPALAARTVGQGLVADAAGIGHLLRREWWPVGAAALAMAPRSRAARVGAACLLAPIAWEWATERPALDPLRYAALRLVDDAAYGSGVIASSMRDRSLAPLLPRVRMPQVRVPRVRLPRVR